MSKLKKPANLRIAAPNLAILHIIIAILLGRLAPLPLPFSLLIANLGFGFAAFGFILGILALVEFRRARPALDSKNTTKSLITSGIYRYTRNPIYLGFVFMLIGLPLGLGSYWGVILVWSLIILMNNLIIKLEESYLKKEFNAQYLDYCSHVRRWL